MTSLLLATEAAEHGGAAANAVVEASGAISLAWLLLLLPLIGFVVTIFTGKRTREPTAAYLPIAMAGGAFLLSVAIFFQMAGEQATYVVPMFDWITAGPLQVSFDLLVDQLTAVMLLVVTGVGGLVHVYSVGYMHGDERFGRFFAYLNLFLFSMLMLVLGSSFLTLFLGWELVGLSSYLLIGFWFEGMENAVAAKKAFITNRVGDVSFMVGMFLIFATFGTLDFLEVLPAAGELGSTTALAIGLLLLGGAAAKSAQIPLYVWLPDAMAGPTPVSALIHAATMVTAGVYLIARSSAIFVVNVDTMTVVAWIGALTALVAAVIAIRQDDIKKILAYSTVSQLGYMVLGVGVGGFQEGMFHLVTHAFFKGLLFLAAGSVMHALNDEGNVWKMGGLREHMPVTFWTSAVATLAISGVPPFAGFWSKDQVLVITYEHGFTGPWLIGVIVAVLTAYYMTRWFWLVFMGKPRWSEGVHPHESPLSMTAPLMILGVLSAIGGGLNISHFDGPFYQWLSPVVTNPAEEILPAHGGLGSSALIILSIVAAVIGVAVAYLVYARRELSSPAISEPIRGALAEALEKKLYVDDLYEAVFVRAGGRISDAMAWFDAKVIDGIVNGAGSISQLTGRALRRTQTGLVRGYVATMALGAIVVVAVLLVQVR